MPACLFGFALTDAEVRGQQQTAVSLMHSLVSLLFGCGSLPIGLLALLVGHRPLGDRFPARVLRIRPRLVGGLPLLLGGIALVPRVGGRRLRRGALRPCNHRCSSASARARSART